VNEIAPGIYHWTAVHPDINWRVSSYYVEPAGIVIDPIEPEDGLGFFDGRDVQQVVLTIGLHWRNTDLFRERFGSKVRVAATGMHRYEGTDREAEPFEFGDEIAPGVTALEVGGIAPDDTALYVAHGGGAMAFADALISMTGDVGFVPDDLWEDPEEEQAAVRKSLRGLLDRDFDHLLFAHGNPVVGGGKEALRDFVK
jgi:glyoxylase-like metal-dependent hydrolase (beta-lactamase superfamily II)